MTTETPACQQRFYFGADYYPEHWPEDRWDTDARLMAEAGFNVVRLAEFAWSKMEPEDDHFDFAWLDKAIYTLYAQGIHVILGTPTASPPPWLMAANPDIYRAQPDGRRVTYGNREEACPNNPKYQAYACRIAAKMGEHFAQNPAVIGWQIDNELGNRCYCPVCQRAFQTWLKRRYGSLDVLNAKWGTVFWSHVYKDWEQIPLPLTTGGSPNPGLALDYRRFASDSIVSFQQMQVDILREKCPGHGITHNFMGFGHDQINLYDLARTLDWVSWDNYPRTQWEMEGGVDPSRSALSGDTMRGLKNKNFWVMEQQAGPGGWEMVSVMPRPGETRLWAYQQIARGADGIVFFRWRTARFGTEEYWHGLLDHDGTPSRRYQEVKRLGWELKKAGAAILGSQVRADVAMLLSYDSRFAFQIQANNPGFSYSAYFNQLYKAFHRRQVMVDVVPPISELSGYKLVVAPALHVLTHEVADALKQYVSDGGTLLVTFRSGVKDEANTVVNQRLPGLLSELCGVEVTEYDSLPVGSSNHLEFLIPELDGSAAPHANIWCDVLKPLHAKPVANYSEDYYAGKPAITLNPFGKGKVIYVGTPGDEALTTSLVDWLLKMAAVTPIIEAPAGVEAAWRRQGKKEILFLLNHTDQPQEVTLKNGGVNLLENTPVTSEKVVLQAHEVLILRK